MTRTDIINLLIRAFGYTSYLEIGVANGHNFTRVVCKEKLGVDPDPKSRADVHITSDDYFAVQSYQWDLIFIDGLHEWRQCERDIENALKVGKCIVCHDMLPNNEAMQKVPRETSEWTGDVWRAWLHFRLQRTDMAVIDTDYGVGVIHPMIESEKVKIDSLTFAEWFPNRKELSNVISIDDWLSLPPLQQFRPQRKTMRPGSYTTFPKR